MNTEDHKARAVEVHHDQASEFDRRYAQLERDAYASTFTYGRAKIERLIEAELQRISPGARALDVGCGTGFNVTRMTARGLRVVGIEPAAEMRRRAQEANPGVEITDGDIEALPFEDASFDFLLSIEVIRYLADPRRALAECARVLRPGGTAFITAAPLLSLNGYALLNVLTSRLSVPGFTHVKHSFMTARGGERAMQDAGFSEVEVHGAFLGPWHVLQRFSQRAASFLMKTCEPLDELLADRGALRDFSNHLVLIGRR